MKINFSFLYRYKFLLTNSKHSWDYLHYHFSADEFYILPILIVASGLHLFLLFTTTWFAIALKTRQLFHVTYKLFLITVLLHVSLMQNNIFSDKHFSLKNLFHLCGGINIFNVILFYLEHGMSHYVHSLLCIWNRWGRIAWK